MYAPSPVKSRLPRQHRGPLPQTRLGHPKCARHNGRTATISELRRTIRETPRIVSGRKDRDSSTTDAATSENRKRSGRRDDATRNRGPGRARSGRGGGASAESGVVRFQLRICVRQCIVIYRRGGSILYKELSSLACGLRNWSCGTGLLEKHLTIGAYLRPSRLLISYEIESPSV